MLSRRQLIASWPALVAAAKLRGQGQLQFFTPTEAGVVEAMASCIIPTDDTPGAREAGVIHFIDLALTGFDREMQPIYRKGIAALEQRSGGFAALPSARQVELLKTIETTEFFNAVRTHSIMGFLANPEYGGNRDRAGWKVIGFGDSHIYRPPFGDYDKPSDESGGKR
jgi:gluconate 2-dehydrogenase gamma chain